MIATFATITTRMRMNFFSRNSKPEPGPEQPSPSPQDAPTSAPPPAGAPPPALHPLTGRTFPADEVVWGIAIRNGFDELDDPWFHRGTTQHAYLEGNDNVAICGFRPPQSGPRTRRRSRLGLPTAGEHPMCGMCARMVVAPRPRVPVPVQGSRPPVAVPVSRGPAQPDPRLPVPQPAIPAAATATPNRGADARQQQPTNVPISPWVKQRAGLEEPPARTIESASSHDRGLLARGVHSEVRDD